MPAGSANISDGGADLSGLAEGARRALASDAVLITASSPGGVRILAADGVSPADLHDMIRAVAWLDPKTAHVQLLRIPTFADKPMPLTLLARLGFRSAVCTALRVDGEPVGTLHFLWRREGAPVKDEALLWAFAGHSAIAVRHREMHVRASALAQRVANLEALDQLVISVANFEDLIGALSDALAPVLGSVKSGIMLWDEQRDLLQLMPGSFGVEESVIAMCQVSVSNARSNSARVFSTGRPYLSNNARHDPALISEYISAVEIDRLMTLPLRLAGRPIGLFHVINKPLPFSVDDLQRTEVMAPRIAGLVEHARTMFRLRRAQRLETVLSKVAIAIASGEALDRFLPTAFNEVCNMTDANLIVLVPRGSLPVVGLRDEPPALREREDLECVARQPEVAARVARLRKAVDLGWAVFRAPVVLGGQHIGMLSALREHTEAFSSDEREVLRRLTNLVALAWATEEYQKQRAESARLQERQRIADDLHDDVAQILFGAQLSLDTVLEQGRLSAAHSDLIARARALVLRGDEAIRDVIQQLSRTAPASLSRRLVDVIGMIEQDFSLAIHLDMPEAATTAADQLGRPITEMLLKVARECLVNAAKHAGPCRVTVRLRATSGRLVLTIVDDGIGLQNGRGTRGHGLASLRRSVREYGGVMRVHALRTGGTKVTAGIAL